MSEPQPRVPPEALSWCVSERAIEQWESRGQMVEKAHHVIEVEERGVVRHKPACGAQTGGHIVSAVTRDGEVLEHCRPAPANWPACRNCWKKETASVPEVFRA